MKLVRSMSDRYELPTAVNKYNPHSVEKDEAS